MQWNVFHSHVSYLSAKDQKRVKKAFALGKEAHKDQRRRSGEPFFTHPIETAHLLADMDGDADTIIAALLHDTIEDTDLKISVIEKEFGKNVSTLIDGITKLRKEDVEKKPRADEQIETLRKMFTLMQKDIRIMVIKLSDRLHNMQTAEFLRETKQHDLAQQTLDIYVKIAERLNMQNMRNELEALCLSILKPELFSKLNDIRQMNEEKGHSILKKMEQAMKKVNTSPSKWMKMEYERKAWPNIQAQFEAGEGPATGISTVTIDIICKDVPGCFQALGITHQLWKREVLSFKDYINSPQTNGYRGLHTTVILEDGTRVRCKIRTEEMQEYALRGITKYCFDNTVKGFTEYINWVERIAPLAEDTVERSEDFWDSLKSDILGEAVLIHGPGDQTMMVPKDASALDAICYFYKKTALKTEAIYINGAPVKFYEKVSYACTIGATFAKTDQVDFSWLKYVNTGIASALIRKSLSKNPQPEKQRLGKEKLNEALLGYGRVGLEEVKSDTLTLAAANLGQKNSSALFSSIAEGTVDPTEVALLLLPKGKHKKAVNLRKEKWSLSVTYPLNRNDEITKVLQSFYSQKLNYSVQSGTHGHLRAQYLLSRKQQQEMREILTTMLGNNDWSLKLTSSMTHLKLGLCALLVLWGLDPVIARIILQRGISPADLTLIRFIAIFGVATLVFSIQSLFHEIKLKRLSPLEPSLLLSGIALFCTALFSYLALSIISATQYILFVVAGVMLATFVECILKKHKQRNCTNIVISFLTVLAGIGVLSTLQNFTLQSTLYAIGGSVGFSVYSYASRQFLKEKAMVTARYPAFLFWLSLIGLLLSASLLPHSSPHSLTLEQMAPPILFVLVFSALPYFLFFEILRSTEDSFLDNALPFVCIATAIGETVVTRSVAPLIILPFILTFLWQFAVHLRSK